jgi:threonine/homoserine/homoserine lactone efflux protein
MPATQTLLVFALVAAAFVAMPGPSNLFVLAEGLRGGSRSGVAAATGCASGAMIYVAATAAGLSALLASSQVLFAGLHYAGAAYLCWLGISALRSPVADLPTADAVRPTRRSYRRGLLVELGNPKVALFFLALFPQFLHRGAGAVAAQVLVLGALFVSLGLASDCLYALGAGRLNAWLRRHPSHLRRQRRATGVFYLGLGAWAAVSGAGERPPASS